MTPMAATRAARFRQPSPLPGFGLALGTTVAILSLIVIIPIGALILKGAGIGLAGLADSLAKSRVAAALFLSFRIAFLAALFNLAFGLALAWCSSATTSPAAA